MKALPVSEIRVLKIIETKKKRKKTCVLSVTYVCIQIYKYSLKNSFLNLHQTDRFILFFDQHNINIDFAFIKIEID